jgi:hypothetical protein
MSHPRLVFRRRVKPFGPVHLNLSLHSKRHIRYQKNTIVDLPSPL